MHSGSPGYKWRRWLPLTLTFHISRDAWCKHDDSGLHNVHERPVITPLERCDEESSYLGGNGLTTFSPARIGGVETPAECVSERSGPSIGKIECGDRTKLERRDRRNSRKTDVR